MKEVDIYVHICCAQDHARFNLDWQELTSLSSSWIQRLALSIIRRLLMRLYMMGRLCKED